MQLMNVLISIGSDKKEKQGFKSQGWRKQEKKEKSKLN
jgi:hypothetical protein